jgi:hypothetical protein
MCQLFASGLLFDLAIMPGTDCAWACPPSRSCHLLCWGQAPALASFLLLFLGLLRAAAAEQMLLSGGKRGPRASQLLCFSLAHFSGLSCHFVGSKAAQGGLHSFSLYSSLIFF